MHSLIGVIERQYQLGTMMWQLIGTIALAIVAFNSINTVSGNQQNKVTVDVYYESLCPYSVRFITNQLAPAYKDLKNSIHVNFVPFGKASYVVGNPTKFTCQHGPDECKGNRAQACVLYVIDRFVNADDQQQKAVDAVDCVMASKDPFAAISKCTKKSGFDKKLRQDIKSCIKSDLGDAMLIAYGEKTKAFENPLLGVPSVAINGVKNQTAVTNFIEEICKVIEDNVKPLICKNY